MATGGGQDDQGQGGIWMYHVTNVSSENQNPRPDWDTIEPVSIANDKTYDGDLLGLPLASFTTTLNEYNGVIDLPTMSPYPRNQAGRHHRVKLNFNIDDHHIYLMGETTSVSQVTQVQLLCIRKITEDEFENEVCNILLKHYHDKKLTQQQLNTYFPEGRANVYNREGDKRFVNVHFTFSISINHDAVWGTVGKLNSGTGTIENRFRGIDPEDLRSLWCIKHYYKEMEDSYKEMEDSYKEMEDSYKKIKDKLNRIHMQQLLCEYRQGLTSAVGPLAELLQKMNIRA